MAIQHRRGNYADFDPTKMVAGEPAVVLGGDPTSSDGKAAYIAFGPGLVKKLATAEDMRDEIYNQTQSIIQEVEESVADDVERAEAAAESVSSSAAQIAQNTQDITDLKADLSKITPGLSEEAKTALLNCFQNVMWKDTGDWYQNLYDALNTGQSKLAVQYVPGDYMAFVGDRLSDLKYKMIVTYDGQTVESSNYELSGTLVEGNSTITVSYNNETADVIVPTSVAKTVLRLTDNDIVKYNGGGMGYDPQGVISVPYLKQANNNRCFYSTKGRYPYRDTSNNIMTGIYPIPVPPNATKVTIALTPSTLRIACSHWEYKASSNKYGWKAETSFTTGTITHDMPITSDKPRALNMIIIAGNGSPDFTSSTEPTQCIITFS